MMPFNIYQEPLGDCKALLGIDVALFPVFGGTSIRRENARRQQESMPEIPGTELLQPDLVKRDRGLNVALDDRPGNISDRLGQSGNVHPTVELKARRDFPPIPNGGQNDVCKSFADCLRKLLNVRLTQVPEIVRENGC